MPSLPAGPAIALISILGYTGFLAGPPAIGWVAEATTLTIALGLVALMGIAIALLADCVA